VKTASSRPSPQADAAASEVLRGGRRLSRRAVLAILATIATLTVTVVAALLTADGLGGLNLTVERLSSGSSGFLSDVSLALPLGLAFAAGMVSSVNPCGFSLLPAYLGLFLAESEGEAEAGPPARLARGLLVGGAVTLGFVILFAVVGLVIGLGARVLVDWLPWIAFTLGVGLVVAGGYRLGGGSLYSATPERLSARVGVGERGAAAYFLFGLSYGIASLSCTLPIFLAVVGSSITAATVWPSLGSLALYGLGMGSVILVLTLAMAVFKSALALRLRRLVPYIEPVGTVALFVAGAYIVYYWLTIGGLLHTIA
jgi:cytochrome c-type biogenesis protein